MTKRVLIVDDEEWIRSVLQDYLEESGYDVRTAATLSLARSEMAQQQLPDVMVVDMTLPDGTGMNLLSEVRSEPRTKEIPFILITAHTPTKQQINEKQNGPDDLIVKPFNLKEFKARLDKQLSLRS